MRAKEIRELSLEELRSKIDDTRREVLELKFQHAALKLESPVKLRMARRRLARMLTIETVARNEEKSNA